MNKTLKTSLVALGLLAFGFAITSSVNANQEENGDVYLTVDAGDITILTSGATIDLGSVTSTNIDQVLSGQFENEDCFRVSDLRGSQSGYWTTISVTDLTGSINGQTKTISKENVEFKAGQTNPHLITGDANPSVVFDNSVKAGYVVLDDAVTYIKRDANDGYGILGVYGDTPRIKVTIPAYTPATDYHGVITYTLYDNE